MTQSTETVSQRARETADRLWDAFDAGEGLSYLRDELATFERELSTNKDETIAKLREALEAADRRLEMYRPFEDIEACQTFPEDRTWQDEDLLMDRNLIRRALTSTEKEG